MDSVDSKALNLEWARKKDLILGNEVMVQVVNLAIYMVTFVLNGINTNNNKRYLDSTCTNLSRDSHIFMNMVENNFGISLTLQGISFGSRSVWMREVIL